MKAFAASISLACAACAAATTSTDSGSGVDRDSAPAVADTRQGGSFEQDILAAHNRYRTAAGVAPLQWDEALAASARAYAPTLASAGDLVHSAKAGRPGQGENLWMGSAGGSSGPRATENWASERKNFRPGTFPNVSATGDWNDVSHYSQVIWPTTTRLGCAEAHGGAYDYVVCRYSPSGNRDGQRVP